MLNYERESLKLSRMTGAYGKAYNGRKAVPLSHDQSTV